MKDSKEAEQIKTNRRKAIKIVGGGAVAGGAAKVWQKPVIDSVVIPSHAAMTAGGAVPEIGQPMPTTTAAPATTVPPSTTSVESNIRLKSDITRLTVRANGQKLYSFRYTSDPSNQKYVGVMAQDFVDTHPDVLSQNEKGYYRVNYEQLGLRMVSLDDWNERGIESVLVMDQ